MLVLIHVCSANGTRISSANKNRQSFHNNIRSDRKTTETMLHSILLVASTHSNINICLTLTTNKNNDTINQEARKFDSNGNESNDMDSSWYNCYPYDD